MRLFPGGPGADRKALRQQLVEEARGKQKQPRGELVTALTYVFEVLEVLMSPPGISEEQVRQVRAEWRAEYGG